MTSGGKVTKRPGAEFEVLSKEADAATGPTGDFRMRSPVRATAAAASSAEWKTSPLKKNASGSGDVLPASNDDGGVGDKGMEGYEEMEAEGGDKRGMSPGLNRKGKERELSGKDKRKDVVQKVRLCVIVYGMRFLEDCTM